MSGLPALAGGQLSARRQNGRTAAALAVPEFLVCNYPMYRRLTTVALSLSALAAAATADDSVSSRWRKLVDSKQCAEAETLCTQWLSSSDVVTRVEGYKCLANVALSGQGIVFLQGDDRGGGTLGGSYKPEAIDKAIGLLEQGLKLAPQDLSIHQGRLHLLEVSGRYTAMAQALEESCKLYKGPGVPDAWVAYTAELFDINQYHASISLLKVLEKYYPDSHDVIGNLGGVYCALKEDDQALPYLRRAVELAPSDPIDAWNLGRLYDYTGRTELADRWYRKALSLEWKEDGLHESKCLYATFVEQKLHDPKRACELQKLDCEPEKQTACASPK